MRVSELICVGLLGASVVLVSLVNLRQGAKIAELEQKVEALYEAK